MSPSQPCTRGVWAHREQRVTTLKLQIDGYKYFEFCEALFSFVLSSTVTTTTISPDWPGTAPVNCTMMSSSNKTLSLVSLMIVAFAMVGDGADVKKILSQLQKYVHKGKIHVGITVLTSRGKSVQKLAST